MIKRIMIALDPGADTSAATHYAADIALRHQAEVTGLAVIDLRHVALDVGVGGVGSSYFAEVAHERHTARARMMARALVEAFEETLSEARVPHGEHIEEGVSYDHIVEDSRYHDLLVLGQKSHFAYDIPERWTRTVAQVVKEGVSPTLLVGEEERSVERVLVAYDGSAPSARTMQRFAQLKPFGSDLRIDVVHVRTSDSARGHQESEQLVQRAGTFLRAHGFREIHESSLPTGVPGRQLQAFARQAGSDLIVAGEHSVPAVRRLLFGSTTHTLLRECAVPVFLFH